MRNKMHSALMTTVILFIMGALWTIKQLNNFKPDKQDHSVLMGFAHPPKKKLSPESSFGNCEKGRVLGSSFSISFISVIIILMKWLHES